MSSLKQNKRNAIALANDQRRQCFKTEVIFKEILDQNNIKYVWQKPFYGPANFYAVDFFIPSIKVVIELDGKIHKKRINHDERRTAFLLKNGVEKVIRIKNVDVKNDLPRVVNKVKLLMSNMSENNSGIN